MRVRNLVLLTAGIAVCVTSLNFLTDSFSLLSRLPDTSGVHRIEAARKVARTQPFEEREHRIERKPRLESQGLCCSAILWLRGALLPVQLCLRCS